ncbi:hypothetical protein BHE74_00005673 [Ensete ventricosum]|nr:hypothetical protein BHE74_00005673 [Ensete ventricosum]
MVSDRPPDLPRSPVSQVTCRTLLRLCDDDDDDDDDDVVVVVVLTVAKVAGMRRRKGSRAFYGGICYVDADGGRWSPAIVEPSGFTQRSDPCHQLWLRRQDRMGIRGNQPLMKTWIFLDEGKGGSRRAGILTVFKMHCRCWRLFFIALFISIFATGILELRRSGVSIEEWRRNEQFWVIGGIPARLFAVIQGLLKVLAGIDANFTFTSKATDDKEFGELYNFKWTTLSIPPTTVLIINIISVVAGIFDTIDNRVPVMRAVRMLYCLELLHRKASIIFDCV